MKIAWDPWNIIIRQDIFTIFSLVATEEKLEKELCITYVPRRQTTDFLTVKRCNTPAILKFANINLVSKLSTVYFL
jgi:hypothetical protein